MMINDVHLTEDDDTYHTLSSFLSEKTMSKSKQIFFRDSFPYPPRRGLCVNGERSEIEIEIVIENEIE